MLDSVIDEHLQFKRSPSESWDGWISRVAAHIPNHSRDVYYRPAGQADNLLKDIQILMSYRVNENESEELENSKDNQVELEDQETRTEKLKETFPILAQLWWANSKQLHIAVEKLADGSRDSKWRIPMGRSGILNFFLEILSRHQLNHNLKVQVLRLIGNCCADKDENRGRIAASKNYMRSIVQQLKDTSLLSFVLPVLFNICVDYEPNQLLASNGFLTQKLIKLASNQSLGKTQSHYDFVSRILALLISRPSEIDNAPDYTAAALFKIAAGHNSQVDLDNFTSLINVATSYLQHEKFQQAFLSEKGSLDDLTTILESSYTRFDNESNLNETEDAKALEGMRTSLNQVLAEISALSKFKEICAVSSIFSDTLQKWLHSPSSKSQLQVCACIMLGNLARHDTTCIEFVQSSRLHKPLIAILSRDSSSQVLHAALGFLKNLAIPHENKNIIGEAEIFPVLSRLWALDTMPQVKLSAVTLGRLLTIGTYENVHRLIFQDTNKEETNFSPLINLFSSTDDEPIKMEVARLSTSICRVLYSQIESFWEKKEYSRKAFFLMHPEICHQFSFLICQTKWPAVRSEVWFVLALTARFPDGAEFVSCILNDVKVFGLLVELLTKTTAAANLYASSTPLLNDAAVTQTHISSEPVNPHSHAKNVVQPDRENALVLISEILKSSGSEITPLLRTELRDLIKVAGEMYLNSKQKIFEANCE